MQVFSYEKNFFRRSPKKTVQKNIFKPIYKILTIQKIVLSSSQGQGNFRGLEASRQGQGLENVFSRTPPLVVRTAVSKLNLVDL